MTTYSWIGFTNSFNSVINWSPSSGTPSSSSDDAGLLGAGALPILSGGTLTIDDLTIRSAGGDPNWGFTLTGLGTLTTGTLSLQSGFMRVEAVSTFTTRFVDVVGDGTGQFINRGLTSASGSHSGSFVQNAGTTAEFRVAGIGVVGSLAIEDDAEFTAGRVLFDINSGTTNDKITVGGTLSFLGSEIVIDSSGGYVFEAGKTWTLIQNSGFLLLSGGELKLSINNGGGLGYILGTPQFTNNLALRSFASKAVDFSSTATGTLTYVFDDHAADGRGRLSGGDFSLGYSQRALNITSVKGTVFGDTMTVGDLGGTDAAHGVKLFGMGANDTLIGGDGKDSIEGGDDNDIVRGGEDDDTVIGGNGNDTVQGGGGFDSIFGGSGTGDIAVYQGNWRDYSIIQNSIVVTVSDTVVGRDATDTLTDFEFFNFNGLVAPVASIFSTKPTAVDDTGTGNATGNVLTNDTDPNSPAGDTKSVTEVRLGAEAAVGTFASPGVVAGTFGTLTIAADGSFSYAVNTAAPTVLALIAGQTASEIFTYRVRDSKFLLDTGQLTITINGVNDPPVITSDGSLATASVNVAENTAPVTTVTSTDIDSTSRVYSISGADASLFSIDAATGVLDFKAAPDFEVAGDADHNNVYEITVSASDGSLSDTQTLSVIVTNTLGNIIDGTSKTNKISLTKGVAGKTATNEEDAINGKGGNDKIDAAGANDTVKGGDGNDTVNGGLGLDLLRGNAGKDSFVFNTALGAGNADIIADFRHDTDRLQLSKAIFAKIGPSLEAGEFFAKKGALKAHDRGDRILYDTKSGKLFYDDDGNKKNGHEAVHFATLITKPTLDHGDFVIV